MSEIQSPRGQPILLGRHLVESGLITQEQLEAALKEQLLNPGKGLGEVLVTQGSLEEHRLLEALAALGQDVIDLAVVRVNAEGRAAMPEAVARRFGVVPVRLEGETLLVASTRPGAGLTTELTFLLGRPVRVATAGRKGIDDAMTALYRHQPGSAGELGAGASAWLEQESFNYSDTTDLVNTILLQGARARASDVHLEPQEQHLLVRYRTDGVLHDGGRLPGPLANQVISRVKVMAGLNIVERLQPQDGQIQTRIDDRELDIRVNIIPSIRGEKAVLRLLDRQRIYTFDGLGFRPEQLALYRSLMDRPFGLVIVAGPTGSGKTSTLYASLREVDTVHRNVVTLEDPVEYTFARITQVAVNPKSGISFAAGLRAILRQDPDVVVVGETRDAETARITVQAALTGHLVLTSLHANDAVGAIYRLLDIGVEAHLLAASVSGVVAQRLVRRVCPHCETDTIPTEPERQYLERLGLGLVTTQKRGKGCPFCAHTGFSGRVGVFSILRVDDQLRRLVARGAPPSEMTDSARASALVGLPEAGLKLIREGVTTVAEVMRVIGADL